MDIRNIIGSDLVGVLRQCVKESKSTAPFFHHTVYVVIKSESHWRYDKSFKKETFFVDAYANDFHSFYKSKHFTNYQEAIGHGLAEIGKGMIIFPDTMFRLSSDTHSSRFKKDTSKFGEESFYRGGMEVSPQK